MVKQLIIHGSDQSFQAKRMTQSAKTGGGIDRLLTSKKAAHFLRVSASWLAKARMRGDGPLYSKVGRSVRYAETALAQWVKAQQRLLTSQR
jgi:hypothetical protein